jgi:hypothetical protein
MQMKGRLIQLVVPSSLPTVAVMMMLDDACVRLQPKLASKMRSVNGGRLLLTPRNGPGKA